MLQENPCLHCGACCAYFRVSFYWGETKTDMGGVVPESLTEDVNEFYRCMKGTNQSHPRCIGLAGEVGKSAHCTFYPYRPTPCRGFGIHWEHGKIVVNAEDLVRCNHARSVYGLPAITLIDHKTGHHYHLFAMEEGGKIHNLAKLR